MKKFVVFLGLILLMTFNVNAECAKEELARIKKLAEKVEFSYDYKVETIEGGDGIFEHVDFSITATNLNQEFKALIIENYDLDDYLEFKYNSNHTSSLKGFYGGQRVNVTFKAYVPNECSGETVYTKTIKLPVYNTFYEYDECSQYPDFKYCERLLEESISFKTFYSELDKYTSVSNDDNVDDNNENNGSKINVLYIIIPVMIVGILVIIINKIVKERRKNSL